MSMWKPVATDPERGSYEAAPSDESVADDITLADENDLALSYDELTYEDPLDVKKYRSQHHDDIPTTPSSPRWTGFASRLRWWKGSQTNLDEAELEEKDDASTGLLNNNWSSRDRLVAAGHQTVSWLIWPLPSYTHRFFLQTAPPEEPRRPTDYLDGLRGVASLFVFFDHYLVGVKTDVVQYGYGADGNYSVFQLPFIRTIYSGSAMVAIFFVISGYVLSARCIIAMRAGKQDKLHSALTSMTFRRGMRLFVPSLGASGLMLAAVFLGLVKSQVAQHWSVWHELQNYWTYLHEDLFKLWTWELSFRGWYATQLWTIPLEFKCSMVLFMYLLATARCTVPVRFFITSSSLVYLFYVDRWDVATFLAGMIIAEINIIVDERRAARKAANALIAGPTAEAMPPTPGRHPRLHAFLRQSPLWATLVCGFYLTGYPGSDAQHTPGYSFLTTLWDVDFEYKFRFWLAQAAILVVLAISFLPPAQRFFSTAIARYLGKISYALYLVHVIMNRTLRFFLWNLFWKVLEYKKADGDDAKFEGGWFLGTLLYVPLVLWAADIFWRAIDIPSVKLAKWVEERCFVQTR